MPAFDFHKYRKEQKNRCASDAETKQAEAVRTLQQSQQSAERNAIPVELPLPVCTNRHSLEHFRVGSAPSVYYIPDFVSVEVEEAVCSIVHQNPWVQLKARRLQYYGGVPSASIEVEPLPDWLGSLCAFLVQAGVFDAPIRPNHVLVNGEGIMAHSDGPLYHGRVAILSMGETTTMVFKRRLATDQIGEPDSGDSLQQQDQFSLVLRPRSLLVFTDEAYVDWLHEIPARDMDVVGADGQCINERYAGVENGELIERRQTRVSLTVRHVPSATDRNTSSI